MNSMEGNSYSENTRTTGYLASNRGSYSEFKHDSTETRFENCKSEITMKVSKINLKRRIQLTLISIFSIITFHKFYICGTCHKIHKRNGNEFPICGGWFKKHVYVSRDCVLIMLSPKQENTYTIIF